ncbi:MAG TPA: ABC transporter permease [Anaerolineae bacterium]|nr:ABC transporter permease [Anaerolineae bacterium]
MGEAISDSNIERTRIPRHKPAPRRPLDAWRMLSLPLLGFLILPVAALLLRAPFDRLLANLGDLQVRQAVTLSLSTTLIATGLTLVFGTPLAQVLARRRLRFRRAIDTLIDLPTVLPPSVAGIALLMAFGRNGLLGGMLDGLGIRVAFTPIAVVLAQTFVAAPFYIKAATLGFASVDAEIYQSAAMDGANSWQVFRHMTMPLAWSAMLGGSAMTWARALGEFGATIIFAGNYPGRTQTMPLAIYLGFELDLDVALTLSVILIGLSFLALLVVKGVLQREVEM